MDDNDLAYHEAGHAVVAIALGMPVRLVTIVPNETSAGHVFFEQTFGEMDLPIDLHVLTDLAGEEAALAACGPQDPSASAEDLRHVATSLTELDRDGRIVRPTVDVINKWRRRTRVLLNLHWPWVIAVAEELLVRRELSMADVRRLRPFDVGATGMTKDEVRALLMEAGCPEEDAAQIATVLIETIDKEISPIYARIRVLEARFGIQPPAPAITDRREAP